MRKYNKRQRTITVASPKKGGVIRINSYAARAYADALEKDERITHYNENIELDGEFFAYVSHQGIRAQYFASRWLTDFLLEFSDGHQAVRELAAKEDLGKSACLEQLELSRRYWMAKGISDWKIVIVGGYENVY